MTTIPEIAREERLAYWREVLEGAIADAQAAYERYESFFKPAQIAQQAWLEAWEACRQAEEKVRKLEEQHGRNQE